MDLLRTIIKLLTGLISVQQLSYISPKVNYREHNRAVRNERCIDDDGVHLNSQGMVHYRRSIIGVLNSV